MGRNKIVTGLDLGSGAIKIAVGQVYPDGELEIIAVNKNPSEGISKGTITNLEDAISSLSRALEKTEKLIGFPLESIDVGISGTGIISQESRGVVAIPRVAGEISKEDVKRVLEAAQTVATPPNYEILHVLPKNFIVDNQIGIKNPIGMIGVRLEVEAQIILDLSHQIKNLTYCLHRVGLDINRIIFSGIATTEAVLDRKQKELGVAVLDLGESTTHLIVYEEGDILTAKVLPIASRDITSSIAIALRSSLAVAEEIKLTYGNTDYKEIKKDEKINLKKFGQDLDQTFSKKELVRVIQTKCEEIFKMADKELSAINRRHKLPAGVILTGAGKIFLNCPASWVSQKALIAT